MQCVIWDILFLSSTSIIYDIEVKPIHNINVMSSLGKFYYLKENPSCHSFHVKHVARFIYLKSIAHFQAQPEFEVTS